jgi:RNA-directed DNA polymerase
VRSIRNLNSNLVKVANTALPLVKSKAQGLTPLGFSWMTSMNIIEQLSTKLNKKPHEVAQFLAEAPLKYKVFTIPKRTSGRRIIAQPSKPLKEYQRAFLEIVNLPIHEAAFAYREKRSIKDNAQQHRKNSYLLKIDLENFFNSIKPELFWKSWKAAHQTKLIPQGQTLIENLLFWSPNKKLHRTKLMLSIGAPSSPWVSNIVMFQFDKQMAAYCQDREITYTRYADDLTFSTNIALGLQGVFLAVKSILFETFENAIQINRKKTTYSSKKHNRHVTGITINNQAELSLGRERKRYIKHLVHAYQIQKITAEDIQKLRGLLAFSKHIEPQFVLRLKKKYTEKTIHEIQRANHDA